MTLKLNQATPVGKSATATDSHSAAARENETIWATFPKEFERSLTDVLDKRFTIILVLTILVDCLTIAYLMSKEMNAEHVRKRIAAAVSGQTEMEREAKFVDAPSMPDLPPETEASSSSSKLPSGSKGSRTGGVVSTGGARSGGAGTITDGGGADTGPVSPSRRTREDISNTASRAGILGLLTSNSGEASGSAAEDVLGGNAPVADIDQALANAGGLRRGSSGELSKTMGPGGDVAGSGVGNGREVRGGRATNAGGIDALVQGLGEGRAQGVQRSGGLEVGSEEPLIEEGEDGKATGTRDRDAVAAIVAKHTSAIQFCYQRELKRSPNLKGKVVVRFVITPQGTVESVAVLASTLGNPAVENCIAERIKRWDDFGAIDPAKGNTTFRQVYTFGY